MPRLQLLLLSAAVVATTWLGREVASQATMFEDPNLDGGWVLPMNASQEVDCGTPPFAEFDNGLSSLALAGGQLRVFRLASFVGLLTEATLPPGFGFGMVNLSPTLNDLASSWTWFQLPTTTAPLLPPAGRHRRQLRGEDSSAARRAVGQYDDGNDDEAYGYTDDGQDSGAEPAGGDQPAVGCASDAVLPGPDDGSGVSSASSVTFFEDRGSEWGDWAARGEIDNFCQVHSGGLDLAYQASAMLLCGCSMTGYDDQGAVLFSVYVEEGYCLDINMDETTQDKMATFEWAPASALTRAGPHETFTPQQAGGSGNLFDLGWSTSLFLAPSYETCSAPYTSPLFPEDPSAGLHVTNQLMDSVYVTVPLGFAFPFFNSTYSSVYVNRNGHLSFGGANSGATATPEFPTVSALLTDLSASYQPGQVTASSNCMVVRSGTAVKPASSSSDWSAKHYGLDSCLENCQPANGYTAIDFNEETGACYCWQGEEGEEYELEAYYAGSSYIIGGCVPAVSYSSLPGEFVVTYQNIYIGGPLSGGGSNSFQVALLEDGSIRVTYLSTDVPASQQVTVGLSSGVGAQGVEVDISASPPCAMCDYGLVCPAE